VGFEASLVFQIGRWTILGDQSRRPRLASAFARAGIPGYIFLEGERVELREVMRNLVTIFNNTEPRLIPLEQRIALLLPRLPSSRLVEEGQWVRCLHGLYRDDIGFVCEHNLQSDLDALVAFVARIPEPSYRSTKRKRVARPVARPWSSLEVEAAWGSSQVQKKPEGEFLFRHERYCSGLIMKRVTSQSIVTVTHTPNDILPFIRASCIRMIPSFTPWAHRFAQGNIRPQQRVRIESGEQKGLIGRPYTITNSVATVVPESDEDTPLVDIPLRVLSPLYLLGDSVKDRWSASHGLVVNINEDQNTLVYFEKESMIEVSLIYLGCTVNRDHLRSHHQWMR
jgi:hypothetical protein